MSDTPALLVLADGTQFKGRAIGVSGHTTGELVFNTSMTGYQEILSDPSYAKQIVTFTFPQIGIVGCNPEDQESAKVWASGLIVRDLSAVASNWRATENLNDYLVRHGVQGIADIDTRRLTRLLREKGAQNACITTDANSPEKALQLARDCPSLEGMDLAKQVSTQEMYEWETPADSKYHVVVYDFGVKHNILRLLSAAGCRLTIVPAQTSAETVLQQKPDGIFLSNGPGDPAACDYAIAATRELLQRNIPIFGICLGFQLLGLACGAQTVKMKFGHHGANHPVLRVGEKTDAPVLISSQNHGFAIDKDSLPPELLATHYSLFDQTLQGIQHKEKPVFAFQGHPEASPGPHDIQGLFRQFTSMMEKTR